MLEIWEDPTVIGVNKLDARATFRRFPDLDTARSGRSPWELCLDGDWLFHWVDRPAGRPITFFENDFDASSWSTLPVPSNWELHGYGQPFYVSAGSPRGVRKGSKPDIDHDDNPVGSYRHTFTVPAGWHGMRKILRFDGVKSAFHVWINGTYVGYSQGSMLPADFDVTDVLGPGENLLSVEVYRWCDGSYLEDQDMWYLSGIYRSVTLLAEPGTRIVDYFARATFDVTYRDATVLIDVATDDAASVRVALSEPLLEGDDDVFSMVVPVVKGRAFVERFVDSPRLWSAEAPSLYELVIEPLDEAGNAGEAMVRPFGFRQSEIRDRVFYVNGAPVILKGVNRHEMHPDLGQAITAEHIERDIRICKANNINAIRTAHYPNQSVFYDLCDRYGIYVIDEANVESHGNVKLLPQSAPVWTNSVVDRVARMVTRDRNHPSIIMWSLGNEAGDGSNFAQMRQAATRLDATRPIHYEPDASVSDVFSLMYPSVEQVIDLAERTHGGFRHRDLSAHPTLGAAIGDEAFSNSPIILCEFVHAMGNAVGGLHRFVEVFEKYPHVVGGFIWDFADQSLAVGTTSDGDREWAYGGDFADVPHSTFFCNNGLLNPDRVPHPSMHEVKHAYQPAQFSLSAPDMIRIRNRNYFVALRGLDCRWTLTADGTTISTGTLDVGEVGTQAIGDITWACPELPILGELHLLLELVTRSATQWADAGHVIAYDQVLLRAAATRATSEVTAVDRRAARIAPGLEVEFDEEAGVLVRMTFEGRDLLAGPLVPNLWRVPVGNEAALPHIAPGPVQPLFRRTAWRKAAENRKLVSFQTVRHADITEVESRFEVAGCRGPLTVRYAVGETVAVTLEAEFWRPPIRVGMQLAVPDEFDHWRWFGRGPHETMFDRKGSGWIGIHEGTVVDLGSKYIAPQEHANRSDVRWSSFTDQSGAGLMIERTGPLVGVSAWPYSQHDLAVATHIHELPRRDFITVNVDMAQRGVGDLTSVIRPTAHHRLSRGRYQFGFTLSPILAGSASALT